MPRSDALRSCRAGSVRTRGSGRPCGLRASRTGGSSGSAGGDAVKLDRRSVLNAGLALLLPFPRSLEPVVKCVRDGDYFHVYGKPDYLRRFLTEWQDDLWPNWRMTHEGIYAQRELQRAEPSVQDGHVCIYVREAKCRDAAYRVAAAWQIVVQRAESDVSEEVY